MKDEYNSYFLGYITTDENNPPIEAYCYKDCKTGVCLNGDGAVYFKVVFRKYLCKETNRTINEYVAIIQDSVGSNVEYIKEAVLKRSRSIGLLTYGFKDKQFKHKAQ